MRGAGERKAPENVRMLQRLALGRFDIGAAPLYAGSHPHGNLHRDEEVARENIVVKVTERRCRTKLVGRDPSVRIGPLPAYR